MSPPQAIPRIPQPRRMLSTALALPPPSQTDRQTGIQSLSRLAARILTRRHFPTEKNTAGKEKQKTETTRKTPLSLSHGADAMKSLAPRDGKHFASSPLPVPSGMGVLVVVVPHGGTRWHSPGPPPHGTALSQRAPGTRQFTGVLPKHPFFHGINKSLETQIAAAGQET